MSYLASPDQIAQLAEALPGGLFRERLTAEITTADSEVWQSLIRAFAPELESDVQHLHLVREGTGSMAGETRGPLKKVEPGPWRSVGGYLDYTHWADRERFMELDRAIAAGANRLEPEDEEFLPTAA